MATTRTYTPAPEHEGRTLTLEVTGSKPGYTSVTKVSTGRVIDASPRQGLFGMQVAFVNPESAHGVLSELVARG